MIKIAERMSNEVEMIRAVKDSIFSELRVAAPGIIQSFDAVKQTATVKIAIKEQIDNNGITEDVEIPLLLDVPIVIPQAGGYAITLPISAGDECLVVFSDACIDGWWQSGGIQGQIDKRRHDLSDGFAILGVKSQPNILTGYSTNSASLRTVDGSCKVEVKSNEIEVSAPTVKVTGSQTVNVSGNNTTTIDGKDFLTHKHQYHPGTGGLTDTAGVS